MSKNPLVSIIVPSYNHAAYLPERLQSIVNQTFKDFEIILLDDNSQDESVAILEEWQKKIDNPCQFIINKENSGSPFHQWNKGVSLAKGKYIWIAESDDSCTPTLLEKNVKMLENHPDVGIAFCQSVFINEHGDRLYSFNKNYKFIFKTKRWESSFVSSGANECTQYLIHHNTLPNASGILFRKEAYLKAGGGDHTFRLNGDWMLYAKILSKWNLAYNAEVLNFFRMHQQTQRQRANSEAYAYTEILHIQDYIASKFPNLNSEDFFKARKEVSHWWIGSLYRQNLFTKKYWKLNMNLYSIFKPYHKALWWNILYHGIYVSLRFILNKLYLKKPIKNLLDYFFPNKFFNP